MDNIVADIFYGIFYDADALRNKIKQNKVPEILCRAINAFKVNPGINLNIALFKPTPKKEFFIMETAKIAKQMVGFQKSFFDNSYNAMCIVQDQTENMVSSFLSQIPWVPADGKKAIASTMDLTKKTRVEFKKNIDDGYKNFDSLFDMK